MKRWERTRKPKTPTQKALRTTETQKGGLYRVFYVSKDWFIFCSASIFVVFTTHIFETNTSSTLWIFQLFCYKCTCACFTCGYFPPSSLIHLICSLSVPLLPFLTISSVLILWGSMFLCIGLYLCLLHAFWNRPCEPHLFSALLYVLKTNVAQGTTEASGVWSPAWCPRSCSLARSCRSCFCATAEFAFVRKLIMWDSLESTWWLFAV